MTMRMTMTMTMTKRVVVVVMVVMMMMIGLGYRPGVMWIIDGSSLSRLVQMKPIHYRAALVSSSAPSSPQFSSQSLVVRRPTLQSSWCTHHPLVSQRRTSDPAVADPAPWACRPVLNSVRRRWIGGERQKGVGGAMGGEEVT